MLNLRRVIGIAIFVAVLALCIWAPGPPVWAQASGHGVQVSWTASSSAATYNVKRSTSAGTEMTVASVAASPYLDTSAVAGTKYFYVVTSVNPAYQTAESGPSNEVSITFLLPGSPAAPASLAVTNN